MKKKKKQESSSQRNEKNAIIDNSPLFKFINPNSDDKFSQMHGEDLQDLLVLIDEYYLTLRKSLGFSDDVTFGLELEFENIKTDKINREFKDAFSDGSWRIKKDTSLENGAEINSPILQDKLKTWKDLRKACFIAESYAEIGKNSGGHIHIGTQVLGNKPLSWLNFLKLWSAYENIIFRFTYGDYLSCRKNIVHYAKPLSDDFWHDSEVLSRDGVLIEDIIRMINGGRYQAVNFENVQDFSKIKSYNTIEFRCPNGTLEPVIWQNNINLFVKLLEYSKKSSFDNDIITKRHIKKDGNYEELFWYDLIYLDQALELCDLIFKNNFDKVYFLRQYLKSFELGEEELIKSKQFVKK